MNRLRGRGYTVDVNDDLYAEEIVPPAQIGLEDPNQPGVLLKIVENAKASPVASGRPIDTILIGARTGEPGRFYVQVTFIDEPFFEV